MTGSCGLAMATGNSSLDNLVILYCMFYFWEVFPGKRNERVVLCAPGLAVNFLDGRFEAQAL